MIFRFSHPKVRYTLAPSGAIGGKMPIFTFGFISEEKSDDFSLEGSRRRLLRGPRQNQSFVGEKEKAIMIADFAPRQKERFLPLINCL